MRGGLHPAVRLPRQFNVQAAGGTACGERSEDRRKVDVAGAQRQVLVAAGEHVVDMDVDDAVGPGLQHTGHRPFAHALHVADVDGEPEVVGAAQPIEEFAVAGQRVDRHAWLGFESQRHPPGRGVVEHGSEATRQPVPDRCLVGCIADHARPERDAGRPQIDGDVDSPTEKIGPPLPGFAVSRHERRFVLLHGVEQMAAAGFDHAGHASRGEGRPPAGDPRREVGGEGIERVMVERDRQRTISHAAEHGDRVERIDVADAVGAIAEQHGGWAGGQV